MEQIVQINQTQTVVEAVKNAMAVVENDPTSLVTKTEALIVQDTESAAVAELYGKRINSLLKLLNDKRKWLVKPLKDHAKKIDNEFKLLTEPFDQLLNSLKRKITTYREECRREEQAKLEAAHREAERRRKISLAQGGEGKITPVPEPVNTFKAQDTQTKRMVWKVKVTDKSILPLQFLTVDMVALNEEKKKAVRVAKASELLEPEWNIPGTELIQDEQLVFA